MARILIIDDEVSFCEPLAEILRWEGHEVFQAADGEVGLALAFSACPDIVLCDVGLPVVDGFAVLKRLRDDGTLPLTAFIFISARTNPEDIQLGLSLGASCYLTKPFSIEDLLRVINAHLRKK